MRIRVGVRRGERSGHEDDIRRGEPVTFGVPLPRGTAETSWVLGAAGETPRTVQTRVLDRWPDGGPRWMLVDAQVDLRAPDTEYRLEPSSESARPAAAESIHVSESAGGVLVSTGAAVFRLAPGSGFPFASVEVDGIPVLAVPSRLELVDMRGARHAVVTDALQVEERGPLRTTIRFRGHVTSGLAAPYDVTAHLDFHAGLPTVRARVTLTNPNAAVHQGGFWDLGDPGSGLIRSFGLTIPLPSSADPVQAWMSAEPAHAPIATGAPVELHQESSGGEHWQSPNHIDRDRKVPLTFRGYRLTQPDGETTGLRATPLVSLTKGRARITATVPAFWQNFPQLVRAGADGLALQFLSGAHAGAHELQGGEQKTWECYLSFGADRVSDPALGWCRSRALASVDPAWCLSTGALPFVAPLGAAQAALVQSAIEGPDRFEAKREAVDEFGWRHFGEIYGDHEGVRHTGPFPLVSHYNNQYDPIAGFACQFLRTGDPRWWRMMAELAAHVIDIDVYHTTRDKSAYNHGLFWHTYHYGEADTATHRTYPRSARGRTHGGGPSADHNYTTGLMLHHFLTGDEASRQTVIDLADFVIDMDDGRKTVFRWLDAGDTGRAALSATGYFGPGRGPANSLNALVDAYRLTGHERFRRKAEQLIRRVIHPKEDIALRRLDTPELRWFYTMFLQSLGKYLHDKVERDELDEMYAYARESLLHYARWMAEHEHPYLDKPEKLEFATETWAAQDIRKSDAFGYAALHAGAGERARFLERAAFFHEYSTRTLAGLPTRTLARPVVVLLTSGFLWSWLTGHPDAAEPAPRARAAFGPVEVFVPQRTRAKRRAVQLAVVGGTLVFALGLGWLLM